MHTQLQQRPAQRLHGTGFYDPWTGQPTAAHHAHVRRLQRRQRRKEVLHGFAIGFVSAATAVLVFAGSFFVASRYAPSLDLPVLDKGVSQGQSKGPAAQAA